MKIKIKNGVVIGEINDHFLAVVTAVWSVYQKQFIVPMITSGNDGVHAHNSMHYENEGWDFRIWGLKEVAGVRDEIRNQLQANDIHYTVLYGDPDHLDHIHIEFNIRKEV